MHDQFPTDDGLWQAIVYEELADTDDGIGRSKAEVLPGPLSYGAAWRAVADAVRARPALIGGSVRPAATQAA